uniref:Hemerythrin n=1 Tax=Chaetozone sp. EP-2017 TaxID=1964461 RepID=A0A1S6QCV0_9ANNE|nr:hemerythrin [Chaetozone sp. EP-2017]
MGFDVPEPFAWDESFRVDYDTIDTEHKGLFVAIFDVAAAPSDNAKVQTLLTKVTNHFTSEEGMMTKAGYADIVAHKKLHADFIDKVKGLAAPVDDGTVKFAKSWLVNHIKTTDVKYKGKL